MSWLLWRRFRVPAACLAAGLVGAIVADASLGGGPGAPPHPVYGLWPLYAMLAIQAAPLLLGVFVGAPLFARELSAGTYRLVLTQAVSHRRWVTTNVALVLGVAAIAAAIAGLAGGMFLDGSLRFAAGFDGYGRWQLFEQQGPVLVAYVAFALALGMAAGAVTGSTVGAMAITLVGNQVARTIVAILRQTYLPPLHQSVPTGDPFPQDVLVAGEHPVAGGVLVDFQPLDRFWTFQAIETAIFAALAAVLLAVAVWALRRRLA